ncbi:outer membrane beta-barrel protein [Geopsychrobacter electrodiphilus]|uniref:outer membrane beta-barrel protein n=1 Tax=Geopsychrobacter electrodiphilus TaxID=225196 RepID=UPI000382648D|nr:outer membrane beta-barrel protein [Geopsychrobacter electrodiphilus]
MKTTRFLFLIIAVALVSFSSAAFAASDGDNYMALKAGVYSPSESHDLNNFNNGETHHLDSKTGFAGEVVIGHYFLPILAVELGIGYFESKGSPAAGSGESKLKVVPIVATGKVFLPIGAFEPYGLFGIGAYISDLELNGNLNDFNGSTETTYGLHAGAGFNINLSNNYFVGLEGKYVWAEPSFGGDHINLDGFVSTAIIGTKF